MSGFEIAGIVLGALPIVIEALAEYRAAKGLLATVRKFRGLLDDLIHQLKIHKTNFYLDILQLLREARVKEILDDGDPTEERCVAVLRNCKTSDEITTYLGQLYPQFVEILGYYETYLRDIVSKLDYIVRPEAAAKDDLDAIIRASSDPKASSRLRGRLKFVMDRKSLEILVKDLGTERYSLGKLIKRLKTQREWEASEASKESKKLAKAFAHVQASALSLCKAASQCCQCNCRSQHNVMIQLENRLIERNQGSWPSHVVFRLCFPIEDSALQEVEVRARVQYHQPLAEYMSAVVKADPDGKLPTMTVTTAYCAVPQPVTNHITNFCQTARIAHELGHILSLELAADILARMQESIPPKTLFKSTITLADYLAATARDPNARLSPKQQTLLALDVATAVLQFRHTSWCNTPWNSKTIKFLLEGNGSLPTFAPYVDQSNSQVVLNNPKIHTQVTKATVLEIAILLLEILHHKSIETWATENGQQKPTTFWERLEAATGWLEHSSDKLLPDHLRPVEACLAQCVRGNLSWDFEFQELYCENIIRPLRQLVSPRPMGY